METLFVTGLLIKIKTARLEIYIQDKVKEDSFVGLPFTDIIMQYLAIEMVYLIGSKEKTDVVV